MPTPVSYFDWHEGSGGTTTSIVPGGYALTSAVDFVNGGGIGVFGPAGVVSAFSIALEITVTARPVSGNGTMVDWTTKFANMDNLGRPGIYPSFASSSPVPLNTKGLLVFTLTATTVKIYWQGAEIGSYTGTYSIDPGGICKIYRDNGLAYTMHTFRYWDATLTPAEVAALTAPPAATVLPSAIVSAEVVGAHVLSVGPVAVLPSAVASAEAVGTHALTVGTPPAPVPPGTVPVMFGTPRTVGHAQYVGSMSADGYPGSPTFQPIQDRPSYGWYPLASEVPLGNDDYTQRVITSLVVGVPDVSPYAAGDLVVIAGEDYVVSEDVRDFTTGPFGRGPGGVVIVEKVTG